MSTLPEKLVAEGFSIVCATCEKLLTARARGAPNCGQRACGSVLSGTTFPLYKGPLTLDRVCFVCGHDPIALVSIPGSKQELGLCETHLPMLQGVPPTNVIVVRRAGQIVLASELSKPRASKGAQIFAEAEAYFAKKDAQRE